MTEPLTPQQVNAILFPAEVHIDGEFIGYASDVQIQFGRTLKPLSAEEAKRVMNELAAEYRKTHPDAPTEITGTFDAYTDE